MTGDVDHVIDAPENPEVAVRGAHRAIAGQVWPVTPILALPILAILFVVGRDETVRVPPDRLENARPGIPNADIAGFTTSRRDLLTELVVNHWKHAKHARTTTARFHRVQRRERATEKSSVFGLPPRVDNNSLAFADDLVVPPPHLRFDWLAHRCHVLEVVAVLFGLIRARLAQHADGRRRGVEDVHPQSLGDPPRPSRVRIGRYPLVHHARRTQR